MFITFLEDTGKGSPTMRDRALTAASRWNTGVNVVDAAASIINRMDLGSTVSTALDPNAVLMTTTCVVLSAASDVASLKIPNLTMTKILQSLAKIEGKLDTILKTPLNNAIDFFHRAINYILTGNNEDALKIIADLYKEATTAFNYGIGLDGKNISLKSYKECAKATRLKIFATVLEASYDKTADMFLPPHKLPEKKVNIIGVELERIVQKCLEQRSNVNTTKFFMEDTSKKSEVQDTLDSVLKMAYPYISEHKQLSSRKRGLAHEDSIQLSLTPALLPWGYEDRTELGVGVVNDQKGRKTIVVKVNVWRETNAVYYERNSKCFIKKFTTETNVVDMSDAVRSCYCFGRKAKSITLSATGAAAKKWPQFLGSYEATGEEEDGAPVFRKSDGYYLYRRKDGTWRAGYEIGYSGAYRSVDTAAECPASISQWQYRDHGVWRSGDITAQCSVHTQ